MMKKLWYLLTLRPWKLFEEEESIIGHYSLQFYIERLSIGNRMIPYEGYGRVVTGTSKEARSLVKAFQKKYPEGTAYVEELKDYQRTVTLDDKVVSLEIANYCKEHGFISYNLCYFDEDEDGNYISRCRKCNGEVERDLSELSDKEVLKRVKAHAKVAA